MANLSASQALFDRQMAEIELRTSQCCSRIDSLADTILLTLSEHGRMLADIGSLLSDETRILKRLPEALAQTPAR